jgi:WD40 repeat protein
VHHAELNGREQQFTDASVIAAERTRTIERRHSRRLRRLLAAVAVLAVVAGLLAAYALHARSNALDDKRAARSTGQQALSRQVASQALDLESADPALAEQLALAAYRISPTGEAQGAVIDESSQAVITRVLGVQGPTALAISPNGQVVAVGHATDGSVHLYATHSGGVPTPLGTVRGAGVDSQVFALAFSPDGRLLATGGEQQAVHLWDVSDPRRPHPLATLSPAFSGDVESIAISPDGHTLTAASSAPDPLCEWDIADPTRAVERPAPPVPGGFALAMSVAFSPDGRQLAAGGSDGDVLLWPANRSTSPPRVLHAGTGTVNALAFSSRSDNLYSGDIAGVVDEWALPGGTVAHTLSGATNSAVNALAVSADGTQVAIGRADNAVEQVSADLKTVEATVPNPGPVTGVDYSRTSPTLYATAADGTLRSWPAAERSIPVVGSVFNLGYSKSGARLLVARNGPAAGVQVWDLRNPDRPAALSPLLTLPAPNGVDGTGAITVDGDLVAAANGIGQVGLWDVSDPARPRATTAPFAGAKALVEGLAFSPDGTLLGVASDDKTITLWDVRDPSHPRRVGSVHGGNLMLSLAFSPNGHLLAGANADDHAYVWNIADPSRPVKLDTLGGFESYVYGVAFNAASTMIAVTSADHTSRLWRLTPTGRASAFGGALIGPTDYISTAAFSPDGRLLAVASNDHTVRLYRPLDAATTDVPFETLHGLNAAVFTVAFSPDGKTVVAAGRAGTVATWALNAKTYARRLCPAAGTPITRQEWSLYVPGAPYDPPCQ